MIISLTGFMGAGKSSVAPIIAEILGFSFYDLDQLIEEREGLTVQDIFSRYGEEWFREAESRTLLSIMEKGSSGEIGSRDAIISDIVLSLGGGTLIRPSNRTILKEGSFCVYLRARPETIAVRVLAGGQNRPLLRQKDNTDLIDKIRGMLNEREEGYLESSSLVIDTDCLTVEECAEKIADTFRLSLL
ncbi:MAG: shikimate kinase [Bacteroidales bacterium]|nr:shikimate kinase [Bacteroidales bacterium]